MIIAPDQKPAGFIYADGGARNEAELFQCSVINESDELSRFLTARLMGLTLISPQESEIRLSWLNWGKMNPEIWQILMSSG
jgi:hypothetical protein